MQDKDIQAIAAAVALKIQGLVWNPLTDDMIEALGSYAWNTQCIFPGDGFQGALMRVYWTPKPAPRLEVWIMHANGSLLGRMLWTPDYIAPEGSQS